MLPLVLCFAAHSLSAGVVFYTNSTSFNSAVSSFNLVGYENWSAATGTSLTFLSDPLLPGVGKGPFPAGTVASAAIRVQSNSLGNNPVNESPDLVSGLVFMPRNYPTQTGPIPSNQLSASDEGVSFDIIFQASPSLKTFRAVSFAPMFYTTFNGISQATMTIRVYNQNNVLVGTTTVPNVRDGMETAYIGIVPTGNDTLGRVNIYGQTTGSPGADRISVYAPLAEPPKLRAIGRQGNLLILEAEGATGQRYAVYSSTNLVTWQSDRTNTLTGPLHRFNVTPNGAVRFYRTRAIP